MTRLTRPGMAFRLLDGALRFTRWVLLLVTFGFAPLVVLAVLGVGTVTLPATTGDAPRFDAAPGTEHPTAEGGTQPSDDGRTFESSDGIVRAQRTDVKIELGDDAVAVRAVAIGRIVVLLALAWTAANSLSAVARTTRAGDAFTPANARRLRRVAFVCLGYPALSAASLLVLRRLVDALDLAGPPVVLRIDVPAWWASVVAGLLLLVVAETFNHGVSLRELDATTI